MKPYSRREIKDTVQKIRLFSTRKMSPLVSVSHANINMQNTITFLGLHFLVSSMWEISLRERNPSAKPSPIELSTSPYVVPSMPRLEIDTVRKP